MTTATKRIRRNEDQLIANLEAKIAQLQRRAAQKKVKRDPALKHINAAVNSINKEMSESREAAMRTALDELRSTRYKQWLRARPSSLSSEYSRKPGSA